MLTSNHALMRQHNSIKYSTIESWDLLKIPGFWLKHRPSGVTYFGLKLIHTQTIHFVIKGNKKANTLILNQSIYQSINQSIDQPINLIKTYSLILLLEMILDILFAIPAQWAPSSRGRGDHHLEGPPYQPRLPTIKSIFEFIKTWILSIRKCKSDVHILWIRSFS